MTSRFVFDSRREIVIPGDENEALHYAARHWLALAYHAIKQKGAFFVALSGGTTPKKLFQLLSSMEYQKQVDWSKVFLFWSDERAVGSEDPESNYHMALVEGRLNTLPIPKEQIFRLQGEGDLQENALAYEAVIQKTLGSDPFDLIMLGMGEDGHTASLFPHTAGLSEEKRLVIANHIPQKKCWRLTFTYPLINAAKEICIYVMGAAKATMVRSIFTGPFQPEEWPVQKVGHEGHPALWILDQAAASLLSDRMNKCS